MEDGHPAIRIVVFVLLLAIDALFSGSEAALGGLNESKLEKKAGEGNKKARRILKLVNTPVSFLNAIELVVTSVAMIVGAYVGKILYILAEGAGGRGFFEACPRFGTAVFSVLATLVLIYLVLVIGIVVPKRVASKNSEKWAFATINLVAFCMVIVWPFTKLVTLTSNIIVRLFGIDPKASEESVTEEEIIMMVSEGHEQGVLEANEAEMINNIFEFNDKEVSDIMTHRRKIVGVDVDMDISEAASLMLKERFSRYPVYEGDIENIIGILHLKDLMRAIMEEDRTPENIREIMRQPYYVPDTQNIDSLFKEMQQKKMHMAIVIDEYGQTAGIVAMEDILEEIVGNIFDEYDVDESYIQPLCEDSWIIRGIAPLDEVGDVLGVESLDEGEFDTLNGLLVSRLEHIPSDEEKASVETAGYRFEVLSVKNNMIQEVKVTNISKKDSGMGLQE